MDESAEITVVASNYGTDDVQGFNVSLYQIVREDDGSENEILVGTSPVDSVEVNSFSDVTFDYAPAESGNLRFKAIADIEDDVLGDNEARIYVKVYPY